MCKKQNYINLEETYKKLRTILNKRQGIQEHMRNTWGNVSKGNDRSFEISCDGKAIGSCTHEINLILNDLSKSNKRHKAMNMAHGYLLNEINRTKRIIATWQRKIDEVDNKGTSSWLSSEGYTHQDSTRPKQYLAQKQKYLVKLVNRDKVISRYLV